MTKKHFKALAEAMRKQRPQPHWDPNKMTQWELDRQALMNVCADFNPRFDQNKFIQATETS